MPIEKVSTASVRTVEGDTVTIKRRDGNVEFGHADGGTMTFTADDLREIVSEFAAAPRKPRGPNKAKAAPAAVAGNGTRAATSA